MRTVNPVKVLFGALCLILWASSAAIQSSAVAQSLSPIRVDKPFSGGSIVMGGITGSCWMSRDEMLLWGGNRFVRFNVSTGQELPLPRTSDAVSGDHWASVASLSPDGKWLVWAGGADSSDPAWVAASTDGTESRRWPRSASISTPAVAWMCDNRHWVELEVPETKGSDKQWQSHPEGMSAKVYSLDAEAVQTSPLRQETPDAAFCLNGLNNFIFTGDGRAWLSSGVWTGSTSRLVGGAWEPVELSGRQDFYELIPSQGCWLLRRSSVYVGRPSDVGMFCRCVRSPDGDWLLWHHSACDGKGKRQLMLSRPDGTGMHTVYEVEALGFSEWLPDSRTLAFEGREGLYRAPLDDMEAKVRRLEPPPAKRLLARGLFPATLYRSHAASHTRVANKR